MMRALAIAVALLAGCGSLCEQCGGSPQYVGVRCVRPLDSRAFTPICDYSDARYIGCYARRGTWLRRWIDFTR